MTLPLSSHGELADGGRSCKQACRKLKLHSGSTRIDENDVEDTSSYEKSGECLP